MRSLSRGKLATASIFLLAFIASLAMRWIHYRQCFWCDEMGVPLDYARASWGQLLACKAGEYVPSNHPLHSILAKILLRLSGETADHFPPADRLEIVARLPSLIAGSLIPLLLAWPIFRRRRSLGIVVLLLAIVEPWLISGSDEARGYALMTLFGITATLLLPDGKKRWPIAYAVWLGAVIYTVPVGAMLVPAHGMTMLRRPGRFAWLRGALMGAGLAMLLYAPMLPGMWYYSRHPQPTPSSFIDFANQLPRLASAGDYLPPQTDPAAHLPDPSIGIVYWILPVLALLIGTIFARRIEALRQPITAMAAATVLFLMTATLFPGIGQMRYVPWCAIWLVLSLAGIGDSIRRRWGTPALFIFAVPVLSWFVYRAAVMLPSQPIREAIEQADAMAPPGARISVGFLAADDAVWLYGSNATHHIVTATPAPAPFVEAEKQSQRSTGQLPWLVFSYEGMVHDTAPQFWGYIQARYELKIRLDGRVTGSPVAIYAPRRR